MMKKLVMFDMDGVLFDTMPRHAESWKRTMHELGFEYPASEFYLHEGRNGRGTIELLLGPKADHVAIYKRKCEIFDSLCDIGVIEGTRAVVEELRRRGLECSVVTGSGQAKTLGRIESEYPGLFRTEWMVTGNDVTNGKPHPEPYLQGLRKAGMLPEDAIVVENAPLGVASGHAAGCFVIAVNTGPLPDQVLLDAGADVLFKDMFQLLDSLPDLLEKLAR